ncbi:MAG: ABC transporter permease [Chloroflexi bacterium]|nr:ABC transporter permease [Chloroflexota bacterium]
MATTSTTLHDTPPGVSARAPARRPRTDRTLWRLIWARLRDDTVALAAAVLLALLVLVVAAAPLTAPRDPLRQESSVRLSPPLTPGYPLGADGLGRDMLSRMIWGGQISLVVGIVPVVMAALVGIAIGLAAGFYGGRLDGLLMRCLDVIFAFPAILLALAIVATLGPSISNAMLAITVVAVPTFARLIRASVLTLKQQAFVEAAQALGAGNGRILLRHILPNSVSTVVVYGTLEIGKTIVFAAGLSFLGLGVQPPTPEWGAMLADGRQVLAVAPHVSTVPGLTIFVVTLMFNVLGDALRDALDPRQRH